MYYTIEDLVSELRLSRATIYRMIRGKGFPTPKKIGRLSRWKRVDVEKYLEDM
ncbi:TPA: helix-turn-helix transcriptional regulator [Pseudomonas aeruginosa]|nr:helix-turn-helix domain-containing protein [Pseudomonas asiatica]MBS6037566.1 helix-turn-helix domain-containing protein [Pseudomonas sp.]